jgi:NADH dehydrogenase [ubiquinone] 1 alpha subcomplex assembly factor 1
MYPSFRGTRLNMENFSQKAIEQISILIGNKKNENFKLIIDSILLK